MKINISRKAIGLFVSLTLSGFLSVNALAAYTEVRFTYNEVNLGTSSAVGLTGNEWNGFGLQLSHFYRYIDSRDPFSDAPYQGNMSDGSIGNFGIAGQSGSVSTVSFTTPVKSVSLDWFYFLSEDRNITYYDSNNNVLESFNINTGSGFQSGTNYFSLDTDSISYFTTTIGCFGGIANIRFGDVPSPAPTPIPGAVWLLGSGLVGLVGLRRQMKK